MNSQIHIPISFLLRLPLATVVPVLTCLVILVGVLTPSLMLSDDLIYFALVLVLAGIVHGASDYFMYKHLVPRQMSRFEAIKFYGSYIGAILAYAVIWYYFPTAALLFFIVLSIYHFGQSNWNQYKITNVRLRSVLYVFWGCLVTLTPLIYHFEEARAIASEIAVVPFFITPSLRVILLLSLLGINICLIAYLWISKVIDWKAGLKELFNIAILFLLYLTTPLLLGFAIYFAFWHSTAAISDQLALLRSKVPSFKVERYFMNVLLMSSIAFLGLLGFYFLIINYWNGYFGWGLFFLFVSVITLPHSFFIEKIYNSNIKH